MYVRMYVQVSSGQIVCNKYIVEGEKGKGKRQERRESESDGFFRWNVQNALVSSCFCKLVK